MANNPVHYDGALYPGVPEEKVTMVERLIDRYEPVVMVGDGVNDAPALARANVGAAMGAIGSDDKKGGSLIQRGRFSPASMPGR